MMRVDGRSDTRRLRWRRPARRSDRRRTAGDELRRLWRRGGNQGVPNRAAIGSGAPGSPHTGCKLMVKGPRQLCTPELGRAQAQDAADHSPQRRFQNLFNYTQNIFFNNKVQSYQLKKWMSFPREVV